MICSNNCEKINGVLGGETIYMNYKIGDYNLYKYAMPLMDSNMFVMISGSRALIIDPCINEEAGKLLGDSEVKELTIILTHEHYDHISGVNRLKEWIKSAPDSGGCKVYANKACAAAITEPTGNLSEFFLAMMIKRSEEERELAKTIFDRSYSCGADVTFEGKIELEWEDLRIVLNETPGHSRGSICAEIYENAEQGDLLALVTGDSLVYGNKIITRLPGGDKQKYREITKPYLESFDKDTLILPGHGNIARLREFEIA